MVTFDSKAAADVPGHNEGADDHTAPSVGAPLGGKGERKVHNSEQYAASRTIVLECEAFLGGTLAECWEDRGLEAPVWTYMNLLAHGDARQIGECVMRPDRPRGASRSWRIARSYLAYEVLDLTDPEFTLADLQAAVLIPLELEMAARADVAGWTPRQWVDLVEDALRNNLWFDQ